MSTIHVLYEDSRQKSEFELHSLVLRCVRDAITPSSLVLEKLVRSLPLNGVDPLLARFRSIDVEHAIAVIDRDRVGEHLQPVLPRDACRQRLLVALLGTPSPRTPRRSVVLLDTNLESFLSHLATSPHFPEDLREALSRAVAKRAGARIDRDIVLRRCSTTLALREHARAFPSFGRLVDRIVELLALSST
ncbi:MAG: hypothetical protein JNM17_39375 [Archangium sp.]|nr:hypothetical protein [Archangium sp.]